MAYNSKHSGNQIDSGVETALGIITGSTTIKSTSDGHANTLVESGKVESDMMCLCMVKRSDYGSGGVIIPISSYMPTTGGGGMTIHLYGDGVKRGKSYTVDYMILRRN